MKKGVSVVIAVVILVAVCVAISVALAGWVFGLFSSYTRTQAVTILASESSCKVVGVSGSLNVISCTLILENKGSKQAVIVNAQEDNTAVSLPSSLTLQPGSLGAVSFSFTSALGAEQTVTITVGVDNGATITTSLVISPS
jgi:FlaG/FlaF family flagellin (archaellin)